MLSGSTPREDRHEGPHRGSLEVSDGLLGCLIDPVLRNDPFELLGELLPQCWQRVMVLLVLLEFRGHESLSLPVAHLGVSRMRYRYLPVKRVGQDGTLVTERDENVNGRRSPIARGSSCSW